MSKLMQKDGSSVFGRLRKGKCGKGNEIRVRASALSLCLLVAACAPIQPEKPEEVVARRALAWAGALMEQDYDLALSYATPAYQSSARSERFAANYSGAAWWTDAEVKSVSCESGPEPERCDARLVISLMRPPATSFPIPIPYDLVWLRFGTQWYVVPK